MSRNRCEACGAGIAIGGGIAGIWSDSPERTSGMTLQFDDTREFFLCFECIESLPQDADESDVRNLVNRDE